MITTVGLAKLDEALVAYLLREGYQWSEEHRCYRMETERFRKWNNKPMANNPLSFETSSPSTSEPFGGDCGKPWNEIIRHQKIDTQMNFSQN